jgi:probable HAF family extracellular repeat protein
MQRARGIARIWLLVPLAALGLFGRFVAGLPGGGQNPWPPFRGGARPAAAFTVTDLGPVLPAGLSDSGKVVGMAPAGARVRAFLWENGQLKDLGTLPGFQHSAALGINAAGQVTGLADEGQTGRPERRIHAFLWERGAMRDLGSLPGCAVSAGTALNDRGEVTGIALPSLDPDRAGPSHVFLWRGGRMRDLGTFGGTDAEARAINQGSQIAGSVNHQAVLWEAGRLRRLGTLRGAGESYAFSLNDRGQVVGYSGHAFLWEDGKMRDLGTLGGRLSLATHINDRGWVVGVSFDQRDEPRAFGWADGRMHDLNRLISPDSGWVLLDARAINRHAQIIGVGLREGKQRAYLLTPAQEE